MKLRFDDRVVLVTGGARGLGKAFTQAFAARGAKVIVADHGGAAAGTGTDPSVAEDVCAALRAKGCVASSYTQSLAEEAGARGAVRFAMDTYGHLDTIVHNAGISMGAVSYADETSDRMRRLLAINTDAAHAMIAEAWSSMKARKHGRIVLIGSTAMYGIPMNTPYATAKASYLGMVRSVACEGEPLGIKANLVGPSGVSRLAESMPDSEFKRWFMATMDPNLVAEVVALLGHEKCPTNGETFAVAGGRIARVLMAETQGFVQKDMTAETVLARIGEVMDTDGAQAFADYTESATVLMNALGFKPSEPMGMVSGASQD